MNHIIPYVRHITAQHFLEIFFYYSFNAYKNDEGGNDVGGVKQKRLHKDSKPKATGYLNTGWKAYGSE